MTDIEDISVELPAPRLDVGVVPRVRRQRRAAATAAAADGGDAATREEKGDADADAEARDAAAAAGVPGTQRVWLRTFGCAHNTSDSEYMEGLLKVGTEGGNSSLVRLKLEAVSQPLSGRRVLGGRVTHRSCHVRLVRCRLRSFCCLARLGLCAGG